MPLELSSSTTTIPSSTAHQLLTPISSSVAMSWLQSSSRVPLISSSAIDTVPFATRRRSASHKSCHGFCNGVRALRVTDRLMHSNLILITTRHRHECVTATRRCKPVLRFEDIDATDTCNSVAALLGTAPNWPRSTRYSLNAHEIITIRSICKRKASSHSLLDLESGSLGQGCVGQRIYSTSICLSE